ncbi:hypothetical protein V1264_009506 [Littorina saxatilis]|uniref:Uridylate-specific endoribonuclease n=1 Tax=Littorina saxatilis TaxID=31220 RepID=A0AAN9ASM7_9CAEN
MLISATCSGRCNAGLDHSKSCQCNTACTWHHDCCTDYSSLCTGSSGHTGTGSTGSTGGSVTCSSSVNDVSEALWKNDVNRVDASMYTLNLQTKVTDQNTADRASAPLFTRVDEAAINSRPTFRALLALQDNYDPVGGHADILSTQENNEVNHFLDEALKTPVMKTLLDYLKCRNLVPDEAHLRSTLKSLWFTGYPRHGHGQADSSGFEHVMVGEFKSSSVVNGLHNWLAYYTKEKAHEINYYGYVAQAHPNLIATNYDWQGRHKGLGSFFVGTSPEFDMALYTLCALTHTGAVRLDGSTVHVQIYDVTQISGMQIASAYPAF